MICWICYQHDAFQAHDSKLFYKFSNMLSRVISPHAHSLDLPNGETASSIPEVKREFFLHFKNGHNGSEVSLFESLAKSRFSDNVVSTPAYVSTPDSIVACIKRSSKHSAAVGVPTALLKLDPVYFAQHLVPLATRFSMCDVAWQMRGSIIHPLQKHKASSSPVCSVEDIGNMIRDVALVRDCSKIILREFRSHIMPSLNTYILSSQYGGLLHRGTDFTSHHLRSKASVACLLNQSHAILYFDYKD